MELKGLTFSIASPYPYPYPYIRIKIPAEINSKKITKDTVKVTVTINKSL